MIRGEHGWNTSEQRQAAHDANRLARPHHRHAAFDHGARNQSAREIARVRRHKRNPGECGNPRQAESVRVAQVFR